MTSWKEERALFTLGGFLAAHININEVQKYEVGKNEWFELPGLPEGNISDSAATVLGSMLYHFGGSFSQYSVHYYNLSDQSGYWKVMQFNFLGFEFMDATVVNSQIVYFGNKKPT